MTNDATPLLAIAGLGAFALWTYRQDIVNRVSEGHDAAGPAAPETDPDAVSSPTTGAGVQSTGKSAPTNPSTAADGFRTTGGAGPAERKVDAQLSPAFGRTVDKPKPGTPGVTQFTFDSITGDRIRATFAGFDTNKRAGLWDVRRVVSKGGVRGGAPPELTAVLSTVSIPWDSTPFEPSPAVGWKMIDYYADKQRALKWGTPRQGDAATAVLVGTGLHTTEPIIDIWSPVQRFFQRLF